MKTYTYKDFLEALGVKDYIIEYSTLSNDRLRWLPNGNCTCLRSIHDGKFIQRHIRAYKDCSNCLGKGVMPISMRDLIGIKEE